MGPKNKGAVTRCTEFGRTPISDIFRGQLRSRVSRAGEQPTDNVQPFFTLQLDVQVSIKIFELICNKILINSINYIMKFCNIFNIQ